MQYFLQTKGKVDNRIKNMDYYRDLKYIHINFLENLL